MTSSSSFCSTGRKSGASRLARSWASTIFSRSRAITALVRRSGKSRLAGASGPTEQRAEEAAALGLQKTHLALLAKKAGDRVMVGAASRALLVEHDRGPGVR